MENFLIKLPFYMMRIFFAFQTYIFFFRPLARYLKTEEKTFKGFLDFFHDDRESLEALDSFFQGFLLFYGFLLCFAYIHFCFPI